MNAPPPTIPAVPTVASSILGILISGAIALPLRLDYSAMSWNWCTLTLSGTTPILVMRGLTFSCVVAIL